MMLAVNDEQELPISRITGKALARPLSKKSWAEIVAELTAEQESRVYAGFHDWYALSVQSNHEQRSARWLKRNVKIIAYWPHFTELVRRRGKLHQSEARAVMPGLLFVPQEFMELKRRDEVIEYAHAYEIRLCKAKGAAIDLGKAEMEIIREIEAKLNLPPPPKAVDRFKGGDRVQFVNPLYAAFWGTGTVFEVASDQRIGVEVEKAIGSQGKVYVPASEIEAM